MQVELTHHVRTRMRERKISEDEVRSAIHQPDFSRVDGDNSSVVYTKKVGKRTISVAVVFPGKAVDPVVVKTAWV